MRGEKNHLAIALIGLAVGGCPGGLDLGHVASNDGHSLPLPVARSDGDVGGNLGDDSADRGAAPPSGVCSPASLALLPSSDVSQGNVTVDGDAMNFFKNIDDGTDFAAGDGDITAIRNHWADSTASYTAGYSGAPGGVVSQVVVSCAAARDYDIAGTVQVKLYDGSQLLGTGQAHALGTDFTGFTDTFSGLDVSSANSLRTEVLLSRNGASGYLRVTQVWLTATTCAGQTQAKPEAGTLPPPPKKDSGTPPPPSGSGYSLAVTSDCHYGASEKGDSTHTLAQTLKPDTYVLVGDQVDDSAYYSSAFASSGWGQSKALIHPTVGNHDWHDGGSAYEAYWPASQRGANGLDYYSWLTPTGWLVIHMNFKEGSGNNIRKGQSQYAWVESQLNANSKKPVLVFFHDHRFSDAPVHPDNTDLVDVWNLLVQHGADLFISGHNHVYERFALKDANGNNSAAGIRQILAGTCGMVVDSSGTPWYPWSSGGDGANLGRSEYRQNHYLGVLKLTLQPHAYSWAYYRVDGVVLDSGTQATHN